MMASSKESLRKHIEKLILDNKQEEIEEILNNPKTDTEIKNIYEIILKNPEIEFTENSFSSSTYISYLAYANFLVRENREEESIKNYKTALKLCKNSEEIPEILKNLTFSYLQTRDIENAFYTGWSLMEKEPTKSNLRILREISKIVQKKQNLISPRIKEEARKAEQLINEKMTQARKPVLERIQKTLSLEIIGNVGIEKFLADHKINIKHEISENKKSKPAEEAITKKTENEIIKEFYDTKLPENFKTKEKGFVEVDVFNYLIKIEDIVFLFKIADSFYKDNYYCSASVIFKILIELMERLHHLRTKFLQLSIILNSSFFSEIYKLSPNNYKTYTESVKKHNISIFLVKNGKSLENQLDKIFKTHFSKYLSDNHYTIPNTYKMLTSY